VRHLQSPFSRSGSRTLGIPVVISPFYSFARLAFAAAQWLFSDGVATLVENN